MLPTTDDPYDEAVSHHGGDHNQRKTHCPEYFHRLSSRQFTEREFSKSIKSFKSSNIIRAREEIEFATNNKNLLLSRLRTDFQRLDGKTTGFDRTIFDFNIIHE